MINHAEPPPKYSLQQVKDACVLAGIPEAEAPNIFDYWHSQGWKWGNGQEVTSLASGIRRMRNYQRAHPRKNEKKCINLNCYERGPAIYGPDDTGQMYYQCPKHRSRREPS